MLRPDIRAAERKVAAASADIGLAEADRYPRLALNGSLGYSVEGGSGSGALSFGTWSFGPSLSLPIFDGGRRKAAVDVAKARYDETLAEFKARARNAIQEVEDALTRYAAAHERAENARVSAKQYQQFFKTVEIRYREGASNLLELEDARRSMLGRAANAAQRDEGAPPGVGGTQSRHRRRSAIRARSHGHGRCAGTCERRGASGVARPLSNHRVIHSSHESHSCSTKPTSLIVRNGHQSSTRSRSPPCWQCARRVSRTHKRRRRIQRKRRRNRKPHRRRRQPLPPRVSRRRPR